MRRLYLVVRLALFGAVLSALAACGGSPNSGTNGKLVLTGSSTIAPLAAELGKRFEAQHPGVRVDVQAGGSARGITDVRQGLATIGMVSRALKDDERDLVATTIARDGVCVIVPQSNPVSELSRQQIVDIFLGKITNWAEVGGPDAPITVVNKAEGRSALELFTHFFKIDAKDIKAQVVIGDNEQGIKTIAGNPHAIGYVSVGTAEYDAAHGTSIKLLPLDGVAATSEHVRDGTFPIARPLNLVTAGPPQGLAQEFIEWARSPEVYEVVKEQSLVPLGG